MAEIPCFLHHDHPTSVSTLNIDEKRCKTKELLFHEVEKKIFELVFFFFFYQHVLISDLTAVYFAVILIV